MPTWPQHVLDQMVESMEDATADAHHATLEGRSARVQERIARRQLAEIAEQLLSTAVQNGLVPRLTPRFQELAGGNTASLVSIASTNIDFVYKADTNPKLVREARTIEDLRNDPRLADFGERLPRVYALFEDGPPYAYLMEYFPPREYPSMKHIFFGGTEPTPEHASRVVGYAVSALADAYERTKDDRLEARLMGEAYYARISANLNAAAKADTLFADVPITINGKAIPPWSRLLDAIRNHRAGLQQLAAPFVTVVHGDPNPGNILVKCEGDQVTDIKFIDLKDWKFGDYIFDIAKLIHFLLHTGPIEELAAFTGFAATANDAAVVITYKRSIPPFIRAATDHAQTCVAPLATKLGDATWSKRLTFAMAANLLGLIPGRLDEGRREEAAILYCEGLQYLDEFANTFAVDAKEA